MSKLSGPLKALINAPFARPDTVPAPKAIRSIYGAIAEDANDKGIGLSSWLTISTATTMTMNSPESLLALYEIASLAKDKSYAVKIVELMREVGLKCISFNGIPRTINCLGVFRAGLPSDIVEGLSTTATRTPSPETFEEFTIRGRGLWNSVYKPFDEKLLSKLADSHPDLPVHILNSHYGPLLSDPPGPRPAKAGRVLTSLIGISCLRAQTGVAPQVVSHCFGLRKAFLDGSYAAPGQEDVEGGKWLASDEGNLWILRTIDKVVEAIGGGQGTTFAPGLGGPKL